VRTCGRLLAELYETWLSEVVEVAEARDAWAQEHRGALRGMNEELQAKFEAAAKEPIQPFPSPSQVSADRRRLLGS
jgi:hypothetical protein